MRLPAREAQLPTRLVGAPPELRCGCPVGPCTSPHIELFSVWRVCGSPQGNSATQRAQSKCPEPRALRAPPRGLPGLPGLAAGCRRTCRRGVASLRDHSGTQGWRPAAFSLVTNANKIVQRTTVRMSKVTTVRWHSTMDLAGLPAIGLGCLTCCEKGLGCVTEGCQQNRQKLGTQWSHPDTGYQVGRRMNE